MKKTMSPIAWRLAMLGVAAASAITLAGCGKQEAENASAPDSVQSMPESDATSNQDSMKDMPMPGASASDSSAGAASSGTQTHMTKGTIQSVDREAGTIKIAHEAVPSLNWPAMTMDFKIQSPQALAGLEEGEQIEFHFTEQSAGQYAITQISPQH
jgi:Cu/Ag efflux protein CusF